ncbi:RNA polymerase sigma factor [Aureibacillus halotolerans]|uniref:RNA polymerase sigma-70 factor (ECF subfamily) n=1 Tax=Aureibacillus halotolerans TaxID=1508390 RepID=A0A4R6UCH2_9BACI|nr:sigma-70 family RNA polymerase sigma factor [Aureibacillus halotolerans]TDQ42719.1 RNA polymerase sigma-70 factor (ECF subfamily) [Aureibacillus halotolerans]
MRDESALEKLYDQYERLLYSFAFRITKSKALSEEVLQEVFIKLWEGRAVYCKSKGSFSSWLLTVTRFTAIDLLRKNMKQVPTEDYVFENSPSEENIERDVEWRETGSQLWNAVGTLSDEQKEIVELFYYQGLTQRKIAEVCSMPLGTVKGRLRLALNHLKKALDNERGVRG